MGKGFRKFKRKMRIGAILRAVAFGLSVGAMVVAGQWLYAKLTMAEPDFSRYILIGGVPALVAIAVLIPILMPTDKRLARRLDRDLKLGEKAQTMIAFRGEQNDMLTLQREDAERVLMEAPRRRARGMATWLFLVLPLLAALSMVGTILVPAKEPPEPPPVVESGWRLDDFRAQKLRDLIAYVQSSDMEEEPRDAVVGELEGLLIKLGSIRKENVMRDTVVETIVNIHTVVSDYNTYDLITAAMTNTVSTPVKNLGSGINSLKPLLITEQMKSMQETVAAGESDGKAATATLIATALDQALGRSGVPATDEVHTALTGLSAALRSVTDDMEEKAFDKLFEQATDAVNKSIEEEATNETVEAYCVERLMAIFGIPTEAVPPEILQKAQETSAEGDYKPNEDDEDHNNAGGLGSGEVLFGSNDTVYDPDQGKYVPYGEIFYRQNSIILEYLTDSDNLPEELREMLLDYFAMLGNGAEQKQD